MVYRGPDGGGGGGGPKGDPSPAPRSRSGRRSENLQIFKKSLIIRNRQVLRQGRRMAFGRQIHRIGAPERLGTRNSWSGGSSRPWEGYHTSQRRQSASTREVPCFVDFEANSAINEHNRGSEPVLTETGRMRKSAPSALESRHYNLSRSLVQGAHPPSSVCVFFRSHLHRLVGAETGIRLIIQWVEP